jgi:formate hydrogenlyase transcriptional activator
LHTVLEFCYFDLLLYDPDVDRMTMFFPGKAPYVPDFIHFEDGPGFWVWEQQTPYVGTIAELERLFPKYAASRRDEHLKVFCAAPLTTLRRRLGILHFSSSVLDEPYAPGEIEFIQRMAAQIAIAIENTANSENARQLEVALTQERNHLRNLLEVTNAAVSQLDLDGQLNQISTRLERISGCEHVSVALISDVSDQLFWQPQASLGATQLFASGSGVEWDGPLMRGVGLQQRYHIADEEELRQAALHSKEAAALLNSRICLSCTVPLISRNRVIGILAFAYSRRGDCDDGKALMLAEIAGQLATSIENALVYREVSRLRDKLAEEKLYLEEELRSEHNFNEMIGESAALKRVMTQIEQVAASDSTVLILGETGTGKELVARAVHNFSLRSKNTLLKLNCSAIPAGLLESELFGHERGAFTGAVSRRLGRMEMADRGTLFLDEVGDIPLELQPKLLRVLQEHEFERVGGSTPVRTDIRLIAATNRNLKEMVAEKSYRSDLFYRLNVFPIVLPPLRNRREDIPLLVRHFTRKYSRKMNRNIETIPSDTMLRLTEMDWPGNIRELENLVERAVILSHGSALTVPPIDLSIDREPEPVCAYESGTSARVAERNMIVRVLYETSGQVAGAGGAAARLGIARSTLFSRMQVLGIDAREIRDEARLKKWRMRNTGRN